MYTIPKYRTILVREGELSYARKFVSDVAAARAVTESLLALSPVESVLAIYLSGQNGLLGVEEVSRGGTAGAAVMPADLFRGAIVAGARAIILAHNHPSGEATPSREDLLLTLSAIELGKSIGIQVLDHIIIGRDVGDGVHFTNLADSNPELGW